MMQRPIKRVDSKGSEFIWKNSDGRGWLRRLLGEGGTCAGKGEEEETEVGVGWGINVANTNVEQAEPIFFFNSISKLTHFSCF